MHFRRGGTTRLPLRMWLRVLLANEVTGRGQVVPFHSLRSLNQVIMCTQLKKALIKCAAEELERRG